MERKQREVELEFKSTPLQNEI